MRRALWILAIVAFAPEIHAGTAVTVPLDCNHGPSSQTYRLSITVPDQIAHGERYKIRIDSTPSGTISHTGLNYIRDMTTDFALPAGATYVAGSLRVVPGTGTTNVASTAKVSKVGDLIRFSLPAHVENGGSFTPPSIELEVEATAAAGAKLAVKFSQYRVTANAIFVGDVDTTCNPKPQPYALATTTVIP
jgi:hypothetical protein